MTLAIITVFIIGYLCIAFESGLKINKSAIALFMCVICWTLYMFGCETYIPQFHSHDFLVSTLNNAADFGAYATSEILLPHLGDTAEIIFFLMGAMTIVEVVDANGGFHFVYDRLGTSSKRKLLWRITFLTFFLSAVLDNMTTSIVMVMVLRKLVSDRRNRLYYAALIVLAANSGGAFSPIGDITTIMLWIKNYVTTAGIIKEILIPSLISCIIPALILQFHLKGELHPSADEKPEPLSQTMRVERNIIFWIGVGGLVMVPIFRTWSGLPPFMGILLVLSILWIATELLNRSEKKKGLHSVGALLSRIDLSTILFFLGILMAVATLQETGVLRLVGEKLEEVTDGNAYLVTGAIGILSSIVDNVPLVAGCMGMYDMATPAAAMANPELANFVQDGIFWQLLAYCAGVGGSLLIIGSAAGVVVMGIEKISFGWYLKNITWIGLVGYLAGIVTYWIEKSVIGL